MNTRIGVSAQSRRPGQPSAALLALVALCAACDASTPTPAERDGSIPDPGVLDGSVFDRDSAARDGGSPDRDGGSSPSDAGLGAATARRCTDSDASEQEAYEQLARVRRTAGLGPVHCDDALQAAARAHAIYRSMTRGAAHTEDPDRPGFTGRSPGERASAAGFMGSVTLEVIGDFELMLGSVYHRLPFLDPRSGFYGTNTNVWDFAGGGTPPSVAVVTWPADGARDVVTWFLPGVEAPNPLPEVGLTRTGYPVSVHAVGALELTAATLTIEGGAPVDAYLITAASDGTGLLRNEAFLVAATELSASTDYAATFTGTVDGTAFTEVVRFRTR